MAIFIAASVSAVSPDCEIGIMISPLLITGFLYLNSDAYSTSTGILSNSSKKYSPKRLECQEVPHEIKIILLAELNLSKCLLSEEIEIFSSGESNLPLKVSVIDWGCSKISFNMK